MNKPINVNGKPCVAIVLLIICLDINCLEIGVFLKLVVCLRKLYGF